jgi:hypothetical protein
MGLEKAIAHGKEKRKSYKVSPIPFSGKNAKYNCSSCRNHGSCPYCRKNRLHKYLVQEIRTREEIENGLWEM